MFLKDAETGATIWSLSAPTDVIWSLDLSQDQKYVLVGGEDGLISLWNFETGEQIQQFQGYSAGAPAWNVVFNPDGRTFFSSSINLQADVIEWRIAEWPLNDLLSWVQNNRYIREFTCEERAQYRIEPLCK